MDSAFWVGFSLEQLVYLQRHPLVSPFDPRIALVFPDHRLHFINGRQLGFFPDTGKRGSRPNHGNYLALLPSDDHDVAQRQRLLLLEACGRLGWAVRF